MECLGLEYVYSDTKIDVSLKGKKQPKPTHTKNTKEASESTRPESGTVVLKGTATPCQLAGCFGLKCSLSTVGRGFVFGVKVDSKWNVWP